jgi:hypothetical protein
MPAAFRHSTLSQTIAIQMIRRILSLLLLVAALGTMGGCAINRASANLMAGADLSKVKTIYVVKDPEDERGVDELIKANLQKRGYQVTGGPAQSPPYQTDAVVTYIDKWIWDLTMYMVQLNITLRDRSDFPIAIGNSYHTSLTRKSPSEMVDEVLTNIANAKN